MLCLCVYSRRPCLVVVSGLLDGNGGNEVLVVLRVLRVCGQVSYKMGLCCCKASLSAAMGSASASSFALC